MSLMALHDSVLLKIASNMTSVNAVIMSAVCKKWVELRTERIPSIPSKADKIRHVIECYYRNGKPVKCSMRIVLVSRRTMQKKLFIIENMHCTSAVQLRYGDLTLTSANSAEDVHRFMHGYKNELDAFMCKPLEEIIVWVNGVSEMHRSVKRLVARLQNACNRECPVYQFRF
jgi:hypothetical protein